METRRYIMAIALSMLVLVTYMFYFGPKPPVEQPASSQPPLQQPAKQEQKAETPKLRPEAAAKSIAAAAKGRDITIETDLVKAVVSTAGGVITKWELKGFREADKTEVGVMPTLRRLFGSEKPREKPQKELGNVQLYTAYDMAKPDDLVAPLTLTPTARELAKVAAVEYRSSTNAIRLDKKTTAQTLVLTYAGPAGLMIEKKLTFHNDTYQVDIEIATTGIDGYSLALGTDFGMSDKISSDASGRVGIAALVDGKTAAEKADGIKGELQHTGTIAWFGHEDKYFTAAMIYDRQGLITTRKIPAPKETGDLINTELLVKEKPEARTLTLYAGPKSLPLLTTFNKGLEQMVDYGWFGILARPMFWLLTFFFDITKNYGIAIILLTIVVRALLFYPSLKSATAMEEMKALQPQLTALREKHKKDPQKMNAEMMRLYKEHKVNPMGGCLPMLLQLPFFVALYNVLNVSIELRQAPFLSPWIKDLSMYDPYYILPVLMGVSMVLTMKMTSTTADPQQAKMMMFMNIAFIFLFAWLPAGLLLYITLSNVLSIVQQLYVKKLIAKN
jgi:YidC/Oxa1 family membrane protein insertase